MALPMSRVLEIDQQAVEILREYRQEIQKALEKGDLMRVGEIKASTDWVDKIVRMANKPYIEQMNLSEDVLHFSGFSDEKSSSTPSNSGRYPCGDVNLDDILRNLGLFNDEDS